MMCLISVAEGYVEIIIDAAITEAVDYQLWAEIIEKYIAYVRQGDIEKGFDSNIEHCQDILWHHFPTPE